MYIACIDKFTTYFEKCKAAYKLCCVDCGVHTSAKTPGELRVPLCDLCALLYQSPNHLKLRYFISQGDAVMKGCLTESDLSSLKYTQLRTVDRVYARLYYITPISKVMQQRKYYRANDIYSKILQKYGTILNYHEAVAKKYYPASSNYLFFS